MQKKLQVRTQNALHDQTNYLEVESTTSTIFNQQKR